MKKTMLLLTLTFSPVWVMASSTPASFDERRVGCCPDNYSYNSTSKTCVREVTEDCNAGFVRNGNNCVKRDLQQISATSDTSSVLKRCRKVGVATIDTASLEYLASCPDDKIGQVIFKDIVPGSDATIKCLSKHELELTYTYYYSLDGSEQINTSAQRIVIPMKAYLRGYGAAKWYNTVTPSETVSRSVQNLSDFSPSEYAEMLTSDGSLADFKIKSLRTGNNSVIYSLTLMLQPQSRKLAAYYYRYTMVEGMNYYAGITPDETSATISEPLKNGLDINYSETISCE